MHRLLFIATSFGLIQLASCAFQDTQTISTDIKRDAPAAVVGKAKKVPFGKNITLEILGDAKRVLIDAKVCLRQGQLEQFMTRTRTKEHEAIVAADVDARQIHAALLLAGAEPGSPVKFRPAFQPPKGTVIKVMVEYDRDGKKVRAKAQDWIRTIRKQEVMTGDWVFGGSHLIPDPLDMQKPPFYAANDGDVICLSNFETAMLDVPFSSSKENDDLAFEAFTDRIPPVDTPVVVILEPVIERKK